MAYLFSYRAFVDHLNRTWLNAVDLRAICEIDARMSVRSTSLHRILPSLRLVRPAVKGSLVTSRTQSRASMTQGSSGSKAFEQRVTTWACVSTNVSMKCVPHTGLP